MTNQLFGALSKGGLTTEKRPLSILFSDQLLNQKVYLQRIDAEQAINSGINAELLCFATDSTIPLKSFIGCQVAVDQRCDDGRIFRLSGIITGAIQGDSDGAITSYLLTLEDPLSLMDKRTNNRVFLNKSVLDVIKILFQDWKNRSKLFASSLSLDLSAISQKYEVRTQITQRHERLLSICFSQ
ncbi:phage late control D family protein [Acinetobacter gerneri]|uniref:phage late control D family protein n=1 Tax=Acinetobacter gerneri TaxID=202952 RepID=UPI0029353905|nr:phage late control D family protein [Acinetobacter gerneri]MDV2439743.1 phage late control D family protein [Acinetobacter gerneri]